MVTHKWVRTSGAMSVFICKAHLIRSRGVTNRSVFFLQIPIFHHSCATCAKLPSTISTLLISGNKGVNVFPGPNQNILFCLLFQKGIVHQIYIYVLLIWLPFTSILIGSNISSYLEPQVPNEPYITCSNVNT